MNRREFLAGTLAFGFAGCRTPSSQGPGSGRRVLFGVCRGNPDEVAVMKEVGFDFWEAVRGSERTRKKMSVSEMYYGYPETSHGYFRSFRLYYSVPTDSVEVKTR